MTSVLDAFAPVSSSSAESMLAPAVTYLRVSTKEQATKGGREVRGIKIDAERASLVKWAFTAYASGNYSLAKLRIELTNKGLRSVPTPKRPARPLGLSSVHRMLQNPYYMRGVVYRGVRYDGAHERLVEPEVWY